MRTVLLFISIVIAFTSCSKFQYYTLGSDSLTKNQKKEFVFENDSCRVIYNFAGKNGPLRVTVYNKLEKALEVDWKKSAIIRGDSTISFFDPEVKLTGDIEQNRSRIYRTASIDAVISPPEAIDFIPPHSAVTRQNRYIQSRFINFETSQQQEAVIQTKYAKHKMSTTSFQKEKSPIVFRTYLTLIWDDQTISNLDHQFYATDRYETKADPDNFPDSGDRFYITGKTAYGKVATGVALVGLTILLIAAL